MSMKKKTDNGLSLFGDEEVAGYDNIREICARIGCVYGVPGWPDAFGRALYGYLEYRRCRKIRTLSLFSGAGGLDIGFHDLGFEIIESVEIEQKFCNTLVLNSGEGKFFPSSTPNCIDIRDYTGDDLGEIEFIIGGPPCQTFSAAGRRHGGVLGTTDSRGVLFKEYVRLLEKLKPKGFLFENVYGIVGAEKGKPWTEIIRSFSEVGYRLYYRIIDAADFGVPQHRERLIIVGLLEGDFKFPRPTNGCDSINKEPFYSAGCAVSGLELTDSEKATGINGRFGKLIDEIPPGLNYSFFTKELGHPHPIFAWRSKFSDFMYKADPELPVRTIKAQGGQYTGPLHWDNRYFALSEFKRLQTFPDDYVIDGVKQVAVHQIGNSVPPQLARMMALAIRMQVFGTEFPFKLELLPENVTLSFRKNKRDLTAYYQSKAREAVKALYPRTQEKRLEDSSFWLSLNEKFKYSTSNVTGDFEVQVVWSDKLNISVTPRDKEKISADSLITIRPLTNWTIPVKEIDIKVKCSDWFAVTAAWKVLDRVLIDNKLKADLVQLNGYYQYKSQIVCTLSSQVLDSQNIMQPIITGKIVGKELTTDDFADCVGIDKDRDKVMVYAKWLRKLGYEIRNNHTNPQIPEGIWLIPYKFPTLLPESVQLNKTLD